MNCKRKFAPQRLCRAVSHCIWEQHCEVPPCLRGKTGEVSTCLLFGFFLAVCLFFPHTHTLIRFLFYPLWVYKLMLYTSCSVYYLNVHQLNIEMDTNQAQRLLDVLRNRSGNVQLWRNWVTLRWCSLLYFGLCSKKATKTFSCGRTVPAHAVQDATMLAFK